MTVTMREFWFRRAREAKHLLHIMRVAASDGCSSAVSSV